MLARNQEEHAYTDELDDTDTTDFQKIRRPEGDETVVAWDDRQENRREASVMPCGKY